MYLNITNLGREGSSATAKQEWMTPEMLKLMEKRRQFEKRDSKDITKCNVQFGKKLAGQRRCD